MIGNSYSQYKKEQDSISNKQGLKRTINFLNTTIDRGARFIERPVPNSRIRRPTPPSLTREQMMLNSLFNQKNQLWGTNDVVRINRTLQGGNNPSGLINCHDNKETRRLFLPR
jgi:hypothetical protein